MSRGTRRLALTLTSCPARDATTRESQPGRACWQHSRLSGRVASDVRTGIGLETTAARTKLADAKVAHYGRGGHLEERRLMISAGIGAA